MLLWAPPGTWSFMKAANVLTIWTLSTSHERKLVDTVFNVTPAMLQSRFQVAGCVGCAADVTALEPRRYRWGPRGDLVLHGDTEDVQTCILDVRLHLTGWCSGIALNLQAYSRGALCESRFSRFFLVSPGKFQYRTSIRSEPLPSKLYNPL
jgi:hypothetical protein